MPTLMGVDVLGLLSYWGGELGSGRLQSYVPTLMLRKAFSVEKDFDWRLLLCGLSFWVLGCQSSLSGGSHRGRVLLRKSLAPRGSDLSVSNVMFP